MKRILSAIGDLLWPPVCLACPAPLSLAEDRDGVEAMLCPACLAELELLPAVVCPRCGRPFWSGEPHLCGDCLAAPPPYRRARSAAAYNGAAARSITLLKYRGNLAQVKLLAALMRPLAEAEEFDLVVPMPVSRRRRAERGYNQSLELARGIFGKRHGPVRDDLLIRKTGELAPQLAGLPAKERARAIRGAFEISGQVDPRGKRCLLIDDVLTTGATAGEAAATLLKAGAAEVRLVTAARSVLSSWRLPASAAFCEVIS